MMFILHGIGRLTPRILGFAYCRRTWCHHLIVDFISAHPRLIGGTSRRVRGVGTALLYRLVALAEQLEIPCIWGEATAHSAPFYERILNVKPIRDHFFIEDEVLRYCQDQLRSAREQMLARRGKT